MIICAYIEKPEYGALLPLLESIGCRENESENGMTESRFNGNVLKTHVSPSLA